MLWNSMKSRQLAALYPSDSATCIELSTGNGSLLRVMYEIYHAHWVYFYSTAIFMDYNIRNFQNF